MPKLDLGQVMGPQGPQGVRGPQGPQGIQGRDATVNGQNTLTVVGAGSVELTQEGDMLTIGTQGRISNPNLFHNWYFADPINQRGQSSWTEWTYAIDRWITGQEVTYQPGKGLSMKVGSHLNQRLEDDLLRFLDGKQVTISVLTDQGLDSGTLVFQHGTEQTFAIGALAHMFQTNNFIKIWCSKDNTFIAAKLELGGHQTLAHQDASGNWVLNDPPPNKALELAKCQRYYQSGSCQLVTNSNGFSSYGFPVTMRISPAVTVKDGNDTYSPYMVTPDGFSVINLNANVLKQTATYTADAEL